MTWLLDTRFYSYSVVADAPMQVIFVETGAGDPDFNLRRETGLVLRIEDESSATFVSALEPHGEYNGAREYTVSSISNIDSLHHRERGGNDEVVIQFKSGQTHELRISWDAEPGKFHQLKTEG